jgi:putative lipoprotein
LFSSLAITRKSTIKKRIWSKLPEEKFNVTRSDIEKVVADYFYSPQTRAKESSCEIANIETISNNANIATKKKLNIHTTKQLPQ